MKQLCIFSICLAFFADAAYACTTFFVHGSADAVVAKNLDWPSGGGAIYINKRNVRKVAAFIRASTPLTWTSKYKSLTYTETGRDFPWEGINEAGVAVHMLELSSSVVPPANDPRP